LEEKVQLLQTPDESFVKSLVEKIVYYLDYHVKVPGSLEFSVLTILLAVLIVVLASRLSRYISRFLSRRVFPHFSFDPALQYTLLRVAHYIIVTLGVLYALKIGFSVDLTSIAVILGFLSVGIGFGLRNLASDLVCGFILLFERPVKVGDRIKMDAIEARVESISLRTTILITNDDIAVIVPNSDLVMRKVINWSYGSQNVRISVPVGIAYGSDAGQVSQALVEAAGCVKEVLNTPRPQVRLRSFGDWALDFELLVWIDQPHDHASIRSKINYQIYRVLSERGIEIPFPQHDLHVRTGEFQPRMDTTLHESKATDQGQLTTDN